MAKSKGKKQLILELYRARQWQGAGLTQLRALATELRAQLGPGTRTSLSYIANVLREAAFPVEYENRYVDGTMGEPYAGRLRNVLHFGSLAVAETCLRQLDTAYREYVKVSDRRGMQLVRALALKGKDRAASLAANPRVSEVKRREKQEIAMWFRTWLEAPDLFFDWLELRRQSEAFRELFGTSAEPKPEAPDSNVP